MFALTFDHNVSHLHIAALQAIHAKPVLGRDGLDWIFPAWLTLLNKFADRRSNLLTK